MRHKILWLTFWTTMAYWLGGAFGCASQTEVVYVAAPAPAVTPSTPAPGVPVAGGVATTQPGIAAATPSMMPPGARAAAVPSTQPSLRGMDRSHWPKVTVGPVMVEPHHYTLYFRDCLLPNWDLPADDAAAAAARADGGEEGCESPASAAPAPGATKARRAAVARGTADGDDQLIDALSYGRACGWNKTNAADAGTQPFKFMGDVVLLPYHLVQTPPWKMGDSPQW